jgi:hypothetical protein
MSRQVEKYKKVVDKDTEAYGNCVKILIARYGETQSAFLFQKFMPRYTFLPDCTANRSAAYNVFRYLFQIPFILYIIIATTLRLERFAPSNPRRKPF